MGSDLCIPVSVYALCLCGNICIHVHTYICICMCVYILVYMCMKVHTHAHTSWVNHYHTNSLRKKACSLGKEVCLSLQTLNTRWGVGEGCRRGVKQRGREEGMLTFCDLR